MNYPRATAVAWILCAAILGGCTTQARQTDLPERPTNPSAHRSAIAWINGDWRLCGTDTPCPTPTQKTVTPQKRVSPPVARIAPPPPPPAEIERAPVIVLFDFAESVPNTLGRSSLTKLLPLIRANDTILIDAYTDSLGSKSFNARLSTRRAAFVADWLKRQGIMNSVEIRALGACCYASSNDTDEGRALNRRAEVTLRAAQADVAVQPTNEKEFFK